MEGEIHNDTGSYDSDAYEFYFDSNYTLENHIEHYVKEKSKLRFIPFEVIFILCVLGMLLNAFNVLVFTRKNMISSINIILASFEATNSIFFLTFLMESPEHLWPSGYIYSYKFMIMRRVYPYLRLSFLCASNWLAVTIGIWRCVAVSLALKSNAWLTKKNAKIVTISILFTSPLLAIPAIILVGNSEENVPVYDDTDHEVENVVLYNVQTNPAVDTDKIFLAFQIITLIVTSVPCILLTCSTLFLILFLCRASRERRAMAQQCPAAGQESKRNMKDKKLTIMLLIIQIIFVLSYLPDALCVIILIYNPKIKWHPNGFCKVSIMDGIYPIVGNTITFFIYYFMSENFYNTVNLILRCPQERRPSTCDTKSSSLSRKTDHIEMK